jgi:multiple sugar transport system permease protein
MNKLQNYLRELDQDSRLTNKRRQMERSFKNFLFAVFRSILVLGMAYVIIGPLLGIIANSFFSNTDSASPLVYLIPQDPTLERYKSALIYMDYWAVLARMTLYIISLTAIQLVVCGMAGYGFARFNFPLKKVMFACVIITIVLPPQTIMYPLYSTFQGFNPLGIIGLFNDGNSVNLLGTSIPIYLLTLLGTGLRSGLYIFIFVQFFRGLPKEIEEAALIDGAGSIRTFTTVMVPNAVPAIVTVTIFSLVWQYNDSFYGRLFDVRAFFDGSALDADILLSTKLASLGESFRQATQDPIGSTLVISAGVVMMVLPLLVMYIVLQKYFIEGVERSGIVG